MVVHGRTFPVELYYLIFSYLDNDTLAICANVCKLWKSMHRHRKIHYKALCTPQLTQWAAKMHHTKRQFVMLGRQCAIVGDSNTLELCVTKDSKTVDNAINNLQLDVLYTMAHKGWNIYRSNVSETIHIWYHWIWNEHREGPDVCPFVKVGGQCGSRSCPQYGTTHIKKSVQRHTYPSSNCLVQIVAYGAQDISRKQ